MNDNGLALRVQIAFGLACDVEKDSGTRSGFRAAEFDLGAGKSLFGAVRIEGFSDAVLTGFAQHLVIAGGDEGRYKGEKPIVNRAEAIREILIHDYNVPPERVSAHASRSNTGGNVAIFRSILENEENKIAMMNCCLMSNHYHLPRANTDLVVNGIPMPLYPAEALVLLANPPVRKNVLLEEFGGGALAERMVEEIQGIADKIRGTYTPRTDALALKLSERAPC